MSTATFQPMHRATGLAVPSRPLSHGAVTFGFAALFAFFGGLVAWSSHAPIATAAVALGELRAEGSRRIVQHLEGGIIREILVRDGDRVRAGQVLIRLDDVQSRAAEETVRQALDHLELRQARLIAERDGVSVMALPATLRPRAADPRLAPLLAGQQQLLAARRQAMDGQAAVLQQRVEQLRAQITSHEAQVVAYDRQLALVAEEIDGVRQMVERGLERKPRLLALERAAAAAAGARDDQRGQIQRARQGIGEAMLQIEQIRAGFLSDLSRELREVEAEIAAQAERLRATADIQARRDVLAPVDGTVVNLRFHTVGGVVRPSEPLLDLAPADEELLVDLRIRPVDIDVVSTGQPAEIRLTSLKARVTPLLAGHVEMVAADSAADERNGRPFYRAVARIDPGELGKLGGQAIRPGMPAEVLMHGVDRTLIQYLWQPVRDSFRRAFREH